MESIKQYRKYLDMLLADETVAAVLAFFAKKYTFTVETPRHVLALALALALPHNFVGGVTILLFVLLGSNVTSTEVVEVSEDLQTKAN